MSILSDAAIRELCVPPSTFFDHLLHFELNAQQNRGGWPLTGPAVEKLRAELIERATRPLTEEERAAFVPMISPFQPTLVREAMGSELIGWDGNGAPIKDQLFRKIISCGTTSYGYDVTLSDREVKLFTNVNSTIIDPKRLDMRCLADADVKIDTDGAKYVILPPNSYMLGHTAEYLHMPRDVLAICLGKSTYARAGISINATPIEPGWHGNVVIEISNNTNLPAKIYLNEGISQFLFFQGNRPCEVSYADRGGKYQGQTGVTMPKV